jgi:hypothetical protein
MKLIAWYKILELDYRRLLSADGLFIPLILAGKCVRGIIEYNEDWSVKTCSLEEVDEF